MRQVSGRLDVYRANCSSQGAIDTVLFHFDPLTGEDALGESATGDMLQGVHVFNERPLEAFMYEGATKMVVLVNSARQVSQIRTYHGRD